MSASKEVIVQGPASKREIMDFIWGLPHERRWLVVVSEFQEKRSQAQNRLLWGCVYRQIVKHILECTGQRFTEEQLHENLKATFLRPTIKYIRIPGRRRKRMVLHRSTAGLGRKDFSAYVEQIVAWANTGLGLEVSMPRDLYLQALGEFEEARNAGS